MHISYLYIVLEVIKILFKLSDVQKRYQGKDRGEEETT